MKEFHYITITRDDYKNPVSYDARVSYIAACGSQDTLYAEGDSMESALRAAQVVYDAEPDEVPLWEDADLEDADNLAAYDG